MIFHNRHFANSIRDLGDYLDKVVIDEAHCIPQWGEKFRGEYSDLEYLRTLVPSRVPILAASATMSPDVYAAVVRALQFDLKNTFEVNLGNDRPNIYQEVRIMKGNVRDHRGDFDHIIDEGKCGKFKRRMIFIDECDATQHLCKVLRESVPLEMQGRIAYYHSRRGTLSKKRTMRRFRDGHIDVLITTEAAGMVRLVLSSACWLEIMTFD
jgi:superfamily II DNA helicase RecQ